MHAVAVVHATPVRKACCATADRCTALMDHARPFQRMMKYSPTSLSKVKPTAKHCFAVVHEMPLS